MNVQDVKIDWSEYEGKDLAEVLFEKQDKLRILYKVPICDLDIPTDQQQLRAMAWNVVEEAGEVIEVLESTSHRDHIGDELADMTAFFIELLIMSGITYEPGILPEWGGKLALEHIDVDEYFTRFIVQLSLAINTLKNRYWRSTNVKTDIRNFHKRLKATIPLFKDFVEVVGFSQKDLMDFFLRKHEVNLFRIRSKY